MKCALHLQNYEEFLTNEQIYSMIALCGYGNRCYDICSKAFIKLESIGQEQKWNSWIDDLFDTKENIIEEIITEDKRNQYEQLAVEIFLKNPPNDQHSNVDEKINCKFCGESISEYSITCGKCHSKFIACVATGKSIINSDKDWICKRCGHHAIANEINSYNNCPLCHFNIEINSV